MLFRSGGVEVEFLDGYSCMVLDTIEPLQSAIRLYKGLGFQETEPYYDNPMEDVIYMKKLLK